MQGSDGFLNPNGSMIETPPEPPIRTTVPTWITDSTITAGQGVTLPGAAAIEGTDVEFARTTLVTQAGAPPTIGNVVPNPSLLGATASSDSRIALPYTLEFTADQPGVVVAAIGTTSGPQPAVTLPVVAQPLRATDVFVAGSLVTDATGRALLRFTAPNLPGLAFTPFDFFGARLAGGAIQLSPMISTTWR